jgi:poly(glycerol-phosphate) alpha-glucosyltransferase
MRKVRAAFVSVVPSPYQRDLFHALHLRPEVELSVFYMEAAAPDSPWPEKALAAYEQVLPGFWLPLGARRIHVNWRLPDPREFDVIVLNTLMSVTAQRLMRTERGRQAPWIFWGERLGRGGRLHEALCAPLHRAAGIAAIGTRAAHEYRQRFPEPLHFNIPYYCELAPFRVATRGHRPGVTFLLCGQMIARKGVDVLLEAFSQLHGDARLLLVGREAELPVLGSLPRAARERVEYAGFQPPEELPRFFARADVFVLPSRYDGWGVVVNQALGAGLPILCSDAVGAAHDLVEDGMNGETFPAGDATALTAAMQRFVDDPALRARCAAASREKAAEWQPERGAAKWIEAFHAVLEK